MIKTIVLDLDGPLLDGMYRHYQCYFDLLTEQGFQPIEMQTYWNMKRNRIDRRELLGLSDAGIFYEEFLASWIRHIETKEYLALDRLQEGVLDVLNGWKNAGIRLLLATMRNNKSTLHWQLEKFGISPYLDSVIVVGRSHEGSRKSAEVKPFLNPSRLEEALWIGDTEIDILSARELGINVCALTCGLRTEEYLAGLSPDVLEEDLVSFMKTGWENRDDWP